MNIILSEAMGLVATLPPPPNPGGSAADDVWWRILAILLVSLVTVAIFLYLFRLPPPTPAGGIDERQREEEELTRLAAQLAARGDAELAAVVPLRPRGQDEAEAGSEVSNATARLRSILGQSTRSEPADRPAPLRLRDRRNEPDSRSSEEGPAELVTEEPPAGGSAAATPAERHGDDFTTSAPAGIRGDSGEFTTLGSTGDDRGPATTAETDDRSEGDLLGDLVKRRPSEADRAGEAPTEMGGETRPPTIAGEIPTEHDLTRLGAAAQASGNILPFVPRTGKSQSKAQPESTPEPDNGNRTRDETGASGRSARVSPITVDAQTRDEIEAVVRQLLFYANVGELLQGFGLYTDEHLRRFMADSGMPEREFQALFAAAPPKAPDDWTRIEFISRIVRLDGGQVSADVTYVDGHQPNGTERLTFVQDPATRRWLIDDISPI